MIFFLVKQLSYSSSIVSGNSFPFSISDRDERTGAQGILDQFMDLFGVVTFVHDIEVRRSGSVTLLEEFLGMRNVMDRMLGDLQTGDNLLIRVNGDGCFQESFSGFTGSPRIVVAGVRAGEPGGIDSGAGDLFSPVIENLHQPVE